MNTRPLSRRELENLHAWAVDAVLNIKAARQAVDAMVGQLGTAELWIKNIIRTLEVPSGLGAKPRKKKKAR